ncbi:SDR family NAD(P)-dependent oxidoreductase [Streptomyces sp. NRRL F-5053]|uniref:SDR family NAD(P)-dependent oxidoreductase n=1 Tax=Streptomyces sp. NRRL F-5053 TaxID=1463854 RepID=UPI0006913A9D|nr:SDR family NAD(P)-dependent oxidoreductase [Streptomyces sp. NRRL F-5053]
MTESRSSTDIFTDTFTVTADNPLLRGHVVYERSLLPGVGYVDLVLQVLTRHGLRAPDVELRNLTILAPLVAEEGDQVLVTVEGAPAAAGGWRVEVRSRRPQDTADVVHALATVQRRAEPLADDRLSLPVTGATETIPLDRIYAWCVEHDLVHSGLMKVEGRVHRRPGDWVAELELPTANHDSADAFLFHPALFESGLLGGGVATGLLHEGGDDGPGMYLPLAFESFRAAASLGSRCYVRVPVDSVHRDDELIRMRVEFYDRSGARVAEIGRFVAKRVPAATALDVRESPSAPGAAHTPDGSGTPAAAPRAAAGSAAAPAEVEDIVRELVAARLGRPAAEVDVRGGYYELGLASVDLMTLVSALEDRLSCQLSPTVVFEYKTIAELAAHLAENHVAADAVAGQAPDPAAPSTGAAAGSAGGDAAPGDLPVHIETVTAEVAALLAVAPEDVEDDADLEEFGLGWTELAKLADRLNEHYGPGLVPDLFREHRTVRAVAVHLAGTGAGTGAGTASAAHLHPLLHRRVPEAGQGEEAVVHESRFTGDEPFLADHRVRGGRVLPAAAQLEMARAAVAQAAAAAGEAPGRAGAADELAGRVRLDDVVWLRPAVCDETGLRVRVEVRPRAAGGYTYTVLSVAGGEDTLCSQGRAGLTRPEETARELPSLAELRAACGASVHSAAHLYELYTRAGLEYGPAHRSLVELGTGTDDEGRPQVLAELRLPAEAQPVGPYRMHPSTLDGALQATIGLWLASQAQNAQNAENTGNTGETGNAEPVGASLPFAVGHVLSPAVVPERAYAWIRHQRGGGARSAGRLDVTVLDEEGRVCADLSGLSTRALDPGRGSPEAPATTSRSATGTAGSVRAGTRERTPGESRTPGRTDIAIVGVSGRYPEAADLDEFWHNLRSGRDCTRQVPAERWNGSTPPDTWRGGFLDGIDLFDPLFFQISLLEAEYLDPQERLFLQTAHHALEDAGYTGEGLGRSGDVGVFVGVMYQEYQLYGAQAQERGEPVALSGSASTIANRVSYFYDFHGPSLAVDTMCSSSLTAIHLACEAINSGRCEAALAGGVNLTPHPNKYLMLGQRRFLSSDGHCRSFGAGGDGYVPGEGVGAVLLKPLEKAVADGDHIHGVIKGSALNHGGRSPGYSVPDPVAQGEVIAAALSAAGVDPRALSYLEAHGTGTALGDPIEIEGLLKAFRAGGSPQECAIGSVKSNIGHGESAAGIAGLTKVLLQMRHGELVPSLHSATLNPHIDLDRTPLRVQQDLQPWQRPVLRAGNAENAGDAGSTERTAPRLAGVSSFGAGGANAHLVIEEFVPESVPGAAAGSASPRRSGSRPADVLPGGTGPALLVLSARSEEQLAEQAQRLAARLARLTDDDLPSVAWTLQTGRMALEERLALAVTSLAEARARLEAFASDPGRPGQWVRGTVRVPAQRGAAGEPEGALREWARGGPPDRLLALWAEGAEVPWESAYPDGAPVRRISLPGYPFARERCWLDLATGGVPAAETAAASPRPARSGEQDTATMLLRPVWEQREAAPAGQQPYAEHHVLVVGRLTAGERDELRAALPAPAVCRFVQLPDGSPDRWFPEAARELLALARGILEQGPRRPVLLQVVLAGAAEAGAPDRLACAAGLAGLLRTAGLENPALHGQYIECLDGASPAGLAARLTTEAAAAAPEPEVRYRDGARYAPALEEITTPRPAPAPWRENGVYLLTGGAGGLGLVTARSIAASVDHATVVLVGRSPLDDERRSALSELREAGLTVDYRSADVADRESLAGVLAHVARAHGPLTGIVHAAGVVHDGFILRKTPEELARVLAPKVAGLVHLDELTRDEPLETFLCYSSASGAFGNPGQADYAAANAFMDAYAEHRDRLAAEGLRSGRTVSVNWPLWEEGGMGAGGEAEEQLRGLGMAPLATDRGLEALRCALAPEDNGLGNGRLIVLSGRRDALRELTAGGTRPTGDGTTAQAQPADGAGAEPAAADGERALADRAVSRLRRRLASVLKIAPERLDPDVALERYGMDSVIAVSVVSQLEEDFGELSRTLLFEAPTLRELAEYFATEHTSALRALVGAPEPAAAPAAPPVPAAPARPAARAPEPAGRGTGARRPGAGEEIAIIGLSGRYPHAEDLDAFWANVRDGRDCVTHIPADRWERLYGTDPEAAGAERMWGAFLDGIDRFDPLLFGISPREAAAMDPQQRLFLETVWQLLEGSGVTQEAVEQRYGRRVGVYVGAAYQMYRADGADPGLAALTSAASYNLIANRVSYFFGLEGPSLAVDSMCTSSTMAVHLACADLLRGEAELAIAGGVNLTVTPDKFRALSEMELLGSHPGSRSFRAGDGYLPAEAVGAVLLKPLDAALRDGDTVHAVITGTASAHGGRATGFMTPSHRTQVNVMRRALERAGAEPGSVSYVEAAANGAPLADEVEVSALREVFREADGPVAVGTVKSGLGHPEAASGIAQLTKVVLQMRHRQLPPLVAAGTPNPNVDLDGTPLRLCEEPAPWSAGEDDPTAPRRALVNSVAAGGSHVSLVVQAPPAEATAPVTRGAGPQLVLLSAHTPERLRTAAHRLHDALDGEPDGDAGIDLADLAYTSQLGREAFPERLAVQARTVTELRNALAHHLADGTDTVDPGVPVHRGNAEKGAGVLATLLTGARGEAFLSGLVEDGDLEQLGELWVRGVTVPWRGLHRGPRRLLPVPATVFAEGSHWLGRVAPPAAGPPGAAQRQDPAAPPGDGTLDAEQTVAAAWAELLGVDAAELGATSNFFSLGGNSLLATRLGNLLRQWTGAELPVQAVFEAPRLDQLAAEVERRRPAGARQPDGADGGDLDVGLVLESIDLVEHMSDEELQSLTHES